jgi:protein-L-isoaspartate(D-aspartate) O-methyltransferase
MEAPKDLYNSEREEMVCYQIERRGVRDKRVLAAMRKVPRHLFVPRDEWEYAYMDAPLSIGQGQTISQPYIVAVMTELLGLQGAPYGVQGAPYGVQGAPYGVQGAPYGVQGAPYGVQGNEKVLEIGTGSGYQTAILCELAKEVYSLERLPLLAEAAQKRLEELGIKNVRISSGDGTLGWQAYAPYDGILVTAAAPHVPESLLAQLAEGGRLVIPVGPHFSQVLQLWQREGGQLHSEDCMGVVFVPLIGKDGWQN